METRQVSLTAEIIAAARAIESLRAENVRVLYDPFARSLTFLEDLGARDQQARYLVPRRRRGLLPEFMHVVVAQVS